MSVSSKPDVAELDAIRQEAMDFAGIGLYRYTFEGIVQFMDRGAMRILGIEKRFTSPEALVGLDISDLLIYTAPKGYLRERIREKRRVRGLEYRFRTLDGEERWVEHNSYLVEDAETGVGQIQAIIKDITERKRAEEALKESEERLRTAGKAAYDLIYEWDVAGDQLEWFGDIDGLLGYGAGEISRNINAWLDLIHPEDRASLGEAVELHRTSTKPIRYEYKIRHCDGTYRHWNDHGLPILDGEGRPTKWIGVCTDITEQKRTEEALAEHERYYRTLIESLQDGIMVIDRDYRITDVNKASLQAQGVRSEDILGRYCYEVSHGLDVPCHEHGEECGLLRVLEKGEFCNLRHVHVKADGKKTHVDIMMSPMKDQDGNITHIIEASRDITGLVEAQASLRKSEERYRSVYDTAPLAFVLWDRDCLVTGWNRRAEALFGWSEEEVLGKNFFSFLIPEEVRPRVEDVVQALLGGRLPSHSINENLTKDGRTILCEWNNTILHDGEDQTRCVLSLALDITDRRKVELALQESENRFRNIVQASPMGLFTYRLEEDDRLVFTGSNDAAEAILGVEADPFVGKTIEEAFPPLAKTELPDRYREAARDGVSWHSEQIDYEYETVSGVFEIFAFQTSPGEMAVMFQEITERKRAEEALEVYRGNLEELVERRTLQLREAQEELIRKERLAALGKVTAMVSHELRNPLGTVRTSVFSIGEAIKKDDMKRVARSLVLAERNIVRCDSIIDELLNFSRTRDLKLERTKLDDWLARLLEEGIIPGEITCERELDCGREVLIDRERMRRVVVNVLTNAVHTMQEDGASGARLTVSTRVLDGRLELCFHDTGSGISEEDLDRIFEPMFSTKDFGVGLGLPIVRGIMQQHGGDVEIRNNEAGGATVTLWLPISTSGET